MKKSQACVLNSPNPLSPENIMPQDKVLNNLLESVVQNVREYADRLHFHIRKLSDIGRALSGIYDLNVLLEMIVDQARSFTNADAGTLYIKEGDKLRFMIVQNDSLNIRMGGKTGETIPFPPVELKESNVSAFVALNGTTVNIPDVYDTALFDFTGPKRFDRETGYRSKSMMVVVMRNHENDVIGVLQLLNAKNPDTNEVISFSPDYENLTESLASQAAIAISNVKLINDMETLFEAFVKVMATAIDEKSPVTGGHIRRVANLTLTMAEVINQQTSGYFKDLYFDQDKIHELRIAAWMHDIGKVTTPVEIIEKAKKLQTIFDRIHHVNLRFAYLMEKEKNVGLQKKLDSMKNQVSQEELLRIDLETQNKLDELMDIRNFLNHCNEPEEFLEEENIQRLKAIAQRTYIDEDGMKKPFITEEELENLSIRKGSITEAEREKMKEHAYITLKMLNQIPFTKKFKNIPHFAGAHHECLNGTGYPLGLKADEIPFEGKLMAVTDIAEALTSSDRPYKKAMPLEKVHQILRSMVEEEHLDPDLVDLFIQGQVYKIYQQKYESESHNAAASPEGGEHGGAPPPDHHSPAPSQPGRPVSQML